MRSCVLGSARVSRATPVRLGPITSHDRELVWRFQEIALRANGIRLRCDPVRGTETARVPEDFTGRARRVPVGEVSWRTTFRALRHRNYRLFFYGQLVSPIGTWLQQTAMSWFVYEITRSKFLLGAVAAIGSAPMMVFSLWGGSLADRCSN